MKTKTLLCLLCLCAALFLCCGSASASDYSLSPPEDTEGMYYTQRIPQAGISVYIPVETDSFVLMDTPEGYALNLSYPETPTTAFVFFAIRNDDLDGKDIATLDEADMRELVLTISDYPELVDWERLGDVLPDQSVVLMTEARPGSYSEHLVALHGPWIFNVMTGILGDATEIDETARLNQRHVLAMALDEYNLSTRFQTYTFPESAVTLSVPESTHMMLLEDQSNFKYIAIAQPGTELVAVEIFAYWDEAFLEKDVTTVDQWVLEELMDHPTLFGYRADSVQLKEDAFEGAPILSYESDFSEETFRHLVALQDGWGFNVVLPPYDTIDQAWAAEAQLAVMEQILTGEGEVPEISAEENAQTLVLNNTMGIPLGQGFLMIRIPEGYTYRIDMDTNAYRQITFYETSPESKKVELILERDTFADNTSDFIDLSDEEAALAVGRDFADSVAEEYGISVACDYSPESPWGGPLLTLASEDSELLLCLSMVNDYMLQLSWSPSETGRVFTGEEVEAFLSGIWIIE